jgi:LacI family transcriptional regulator
MNNTSLKDIAKEAGVSITTVSFVINGKAKENRISEQVTERIRKIIAARNYRPNIVAQGLRTGKTMALGLIVEDIANHFFGTVAKTIELAAYQKGYKVIFTSTDNDEVKGKDLLQMLKQQQVDGFIITPMPGLKEAVLQLKKEKKPFVLFDRFFPDINTSYVVLDNYHGSYNMTTHLVKKGYKKIAFVTIVGGMNQMTDRLEGYKSALRDNKIALDKDIIFEIPFFAAANGEMKKLQTFIKKHKNVDAIFFATNYLGVMGLECLGRLHMTVPGHVAVAVFDDHDLFRLQKPAISVVAQPIALLANEAISSLLYLLENPKAEAKQVRIAPDLLLRDSE